MSIIIKDNRIRKGLVKIPMLQFKSHIHLVLGQLPPGQLPPGQLPPDIYPRGKCLGGICPRG